MRVQLSEHAVCPLLAPHCRFPHIGLGDCHTHRRCHLTPIRHLFRLVVATADVTNPTGMTVVRGGAPVSSSSKGVVYDAWENCVGETIVHRALLPVLNDIALQSSDWPQRVTVATEQWLKTEGRMMEVPFVRPLALV